MATQAKPTARNDAPLTRNQEDSVAWARYLSTGVAVWLFFSAFLWHHQPGQRANTWVVGVLLFVASLLAVAKFGARVAIAGLATWLLASTLMMGGASATIYNNVIVAIVMIILSSVPTTRKREPTASPGRMHESERISRLN